MNETTGYKAKKELEKIIYDDSGIYRFKQYKKASVTQLLMAYDEIKILWEQEIKYRPSFSVKDEKVNMPVIFAKVNGINGNGSFLSNYSYWKEVKEFMTENAIIYRERINIKNGFLEKLKIALKGFTNNSKLNIEKLRYSKEFKYYNLPDYLREHILEKVRYIIDNDIIKDIVSKNADLDVLGVALKLPKEIIKKLNYFDFTARNPKIIFIANKNRLLTIPEIVLLVLAYYLGFDVLIFAPNGVSCIEYLLNKNIIQIHELGNYKENMSIPFFNLIF